MKTTYVTFDARRAGDRFLMLGDAGAWLASVSLSGAFAVPMLDRITEQGKTLGEAPRSAVELLERGAAAPVCRSIDRRQLGWQSRKRDRQGSCVLEGVRVQSDFLVHAMGLATAQGDEAIEIATVVEGFGPTYPALVLRGTGWILVIAPMVVVSAGGGAS